MPSSSSQLAYVAGFIDGEGCFTIGVSNGKTSVNPHHHVALVVTNTNEQVINFLRETFQVGSINTRAAKKNHKQCWNWIVYGKNAVSIAEQLMPYLIVKRRAAELIIELQQTKNKFVKPLPPEVLAKREALRQELNAINKRGL